MDVYVKLAKATIENYIKTGVVLSVRRGEVVNSEDNISCDVDVSQLQLDDDMLHRRAGVFVSLKIRGQLRGCIGTISGVQNSIAEEIIQNAVSSSTKDPRFSPVTESELPCLEYSVDVLGDAERIDSTDQLDVKRYGVIVTKGYRRGLLLPNLEGVDTVEQQVAIACAKAGIDVSENPDMERFEVVRHK